MMYSAVIIMAAAMGCSPDAERLGHSQRADLVEEVLALMARDKHSPEVRKMGAGHSPLHISVCKPV